MSYVQYLQQQQLRELRIRMYSTAERVICTAAAVVAAVMELRMYCQRCYVRYVLRAVSSTAAAAVVLPFYAATLWVIALPYVVYTLRVFVNFSAEHIYTHNK